MHLDHWKDGIVDEEVWSRQSKRLLIVCPEPNVQNMIRLGDDRRDMRELLLNPEHPKAQFYRFIRQMIRAVHGLASAVGGEEVTDHDGLVRKIAFIDLKNTGGGSAADADRVKEAARARRDAIVKKILSMVPTHIAVATKAWPGFNEIILPEIRHCDAVVFKVRHPSCHGMTGQQYYEHVDAQARSTTTWLG